MINEDSIFKFKKKNLFKILVLVLILFLFSLTLYVLVAVQNKIKEGRYIGQEIESKNTITVSATEAVYTKPDLALTVFSVTTEAETVVVAMEENTKKMNSAIDFIKNQGVEDKDLKTIGFNISPRYEWYENKRCILPCPSGRRVLVGYEVQQSLQVKIRDMEKIGIIIEGAIKKGANQLGDLQFTIDKENEFKKQAREQAINAAKVKAKELASQLGVDLVRITNFNESGLAPRYYAFDESAQMGIGGAVPQIETGENKIEVTVSITYEIN